jgi:hypothetical protein
MSQFEDDSIDFRLISSSPHRRIHPRISEYLRRDAGDFRVTMPRSSKYLSPLLWVLDRLCGDFFRGLIIAVEVRCFKPDFIHVNELQNAGYATLRAIKLMRQRDVPPLFTTNYGSDIVWFRKYPNHRKKLVELLEASNAFSAECRRDYKLARDLGFRGIEMVMMPVAGGVRYLPSNEFERRTIAVKGYQNKWGQALSVLDCLHDIQNELSGFKIEVFSANKTVERRVRYLRRTSKLEIISYAKGSLSHESMMQLFSRSICFVGFSLSDGISTSMIESMANGAIPIQTSTSCAEEWVLHGKTGFVLDPDDLHGLKKALLSITRGEFNINEARVENLRVIDKKYNPEMLRKIARSQYSKMLSFQG